MSHNFAEKLSSFRAKLVQKFGASYEKQINSAIMDFINKHKINVDEIDKFESDLNGMLETGLFINDFKYLNLK